MTWLRLQLQFESCCRNLEVRPAEPNVQSRLYFSSTCITFFTASGQSFSWLDLLNSPPRFVNMMRMHFPESVRGAARRLHRKHFEARLNCRTMTALSCILKPTKKSVSRIPCRRDVPLMQELASCRTPQSILHGVEDDAALKFW